MDTLFNKRLSRENAMIFGQDFYFISKLQTVLSFLFLQKFQCGNNSNN